MCLKSSVLRVCSFHRPRIGLVKKRAQRTCLEFGQNVYWSSMTSILGNAFSEIWVP
jgi:hypothetical protein